MPDSVITDPQQITLDWLNEALSDSSALTAGQVRHFECVQSDSINAQMVHLHLDYSEDATGTLPSALVLKICQDDAFDDSEMHYYTRDYVDLKDAPLVQCYQARYATAPARYHLLLEDVSATHHNNYEQQPTLEYGRSVAQALGRLHAHVWGNEHLRVLNYSIPDQTVINAYIAEAEAGLETLLARVAAEIEPRWRDTLYDIFRRHHHQMGQRIRDSRGFALVHGDVNPGNILSPIAGAGKIYLIDRQPFDWSLRVWLGVSDISYMMVNPWETAKRRAFELPVLKGYLDALQEGGVIDYGWDQLLLDYRLCIAQSVYVSTSRCAAEEECDRMRWLWWPHLQRAMTAYFDWRCDEL